MAGAWRLRRVAPLAAAQPLFPPRAWPAGARGLCSMSAVDVPPAELHEAHPPFPPVPLQIGIERSGFVDLRTADAEAVCGHIACYRDRAGVRRVGVLREQKRPNDWLADHSRGTSILHSADVDSCWRLREPIRDGPPRFVRQELQNILTRVKEYRAVVRREAERVWAELDEPDASSAAGRGCVDLAKLLLGVDSPTNLQALAVHLELVEPACAPFFKPTTRALAFRRRPATAVPEVRAALEQHAELRLTAAERVRINDRLRVAIYARDATLWSELAQPRSARQAEAQPPSPSPPRGVRDEWLGATIALTAEAPPFKRSIFAIPKWHRERLMGGPVRAELTGAASAPAAMGHQGVDRPLPAAAEKGAELAPVRAELMGAASAPAAAEEGGEQRTSDAPPGAHWAELGAEPGDAPILAALRSYALSNELEGNYVAHEPLIRQVLWPLVRKDRPSAAVEVLIRLGEMHDLVNVARERALDSRLLLPLSDWAGSAASAPPTMPTPPSANADAADADGTAADVDATAAPGAARAARSTAVHSLQVMTLVSPVAEEIDDGLSVELADARAELGAPDPAAPDAEPSAWVHVHVASPTARIPPFSALDELAAERATTVCLPEGSVPMLPPEIARGEGGTGLEPVAAPEPDAPARARSALTFSARVGLQSGRLLEFALRELSLPRVLALTCGAADRLLHASDGLEGAAAPAAAARAAPEGSEDAAGRTIEQLRLLEQVTLARRRMRVAEGGALQFLLPRPRVKAELGLRRVSMAGPSVLHLDGGRSSAIEAEGMILAGEIAAEIGTQAGLPLPYRAHQALRPAESEGVGSMPAPAALAALRDERLVARRGRRPRGLAGAAGGGEVPQAGPPFPHAFAGLTPAEARADSLAGTAHPVDDSLLRDQLLATAATWPLLRGVSTSAQPGAGHALLALRGFVHVTSPLRRYLDLVAHHQLRALLSASGGLVRGAPLDDDAHAEACARMCAAEGARPECAPPYESAALETRIAHVAARTRQAARLESESSRYWARQFLAQRAREGYTVHRALALHSQPQRLQRGRTSTYVLLPDLGLHAWMRDAELPSGMQLRVVVKWVQPHRGGVSLADFALQPSSP